MKYIVMATFDLGNDLDYYKLKQGWDVHSWEDMRECLEGYTIDELKIKLGYPKWTDSMEKENADD